MCEKLTQVPEILKISKVSISRENLCFSRESLGASRFEFEVSLLEDSLFYFFIDKVKMNNIKCFLNKKISLYFHEERKKITGELQKPLKKELERFSLNKNEEMAESFFKNKDMKGEILVFIPEEYHSCDLSYSFY